MTKTKIKKATQKSNKILMKFLKQTKEGKFASVDKDSLKYSRFEENIETVNIDEGNYYYSLS